MSSLAFDATGAAPQAVEQHVPAAGRRPGRLPDLRQGRHPVGSGRRGRGRHPARLGGGRRRLARRWWPRSWRCATRCTAEGVNHDRARAAWAAPRWLPRSSPRTAGVELTVLDSTDPDQVARRPGGPAGRHRHRGVLQVRLHRWRPTRSAGSSSRRSPTPASTPKSRIIVVTDPGSPLDKSRPRGRLPPVFNADPNVGGRYSALTAFGLVPSGLAGVDIEALLDEAEEAAEVLRRRRRGQHRAGPRRRDGAAPTRCATSSVIVADGSGIVGFADWAEQLIAESTGKLGTGHAAGRRRARRPGARRRTARRPGRPAGRRRGRRRRRHVGDATRSLVAGGLGAQMLVWEFATAVAGRLLGINPFDQPDVEAAKVAARGLLDARPEPTPAAFVDGAIEVRGSRDWLGERRRPRPARCEALLGAARRRTATSSVQAYVDRLGYAPLAGHPRTAGRGITAARSPSAGDRASCTPPASSTRADPPIGVFLQITAAAAEDLAIPGPAVHLRRADPGPGRRRRQRARRPRPARAAPAPHGPRRGRRTARSRSSPRWPARRTDRKLRQLHMPHRWQITPRQFNPLRDPPRPAAEPHRRPVAPRHLRGDR